MTVIVPVVVLGGGGGAAGNKRQYCNEHTPKPENTEVISLEVSLMFWTLRSCYEQVRVCVNFGSKLFVLMAAFFMAFAQ